MDALKKAVKEKASKIAAAAAAATGAEIEKSRAEALERTHANVDKLLGAKTDAEAESAMKSMGGRRRRKTRRGKKSRRSTRKSRR